MYKRSNEPLFSHSFSLLLSPCLDVERSHSALYTYLQSMSTCHVQNAGWRQKPLHGPELTGTWAMGTLWSLGLRGPRQRGKAGEVALWFGV